LLYFVKSYFASSGQAVYPLWWPSLTKDMQTEQLLFWSDMTDTEHQKKRKKKGKWFL